MAYIISSPKEEQAQRASRYEISEPPKENEPVSKPRSVLDALLKGLVEGATSFGRMLGPLQEQFPGDEQQTAERRQKLLEEYLPSEEGFLEETAGRFGKSAPLLATGGGALRNVLTRGLQGAALAGAAKSMGAPDYVGDVLEVGAQLRPNLGKRIQAKPSQEEIVNFMREKGFTEEQIAPLLQEGKKGTLLSKIASKSGKTEQALKSTKSAAKQTYEILMESPSAKKPIKGQAELVEELQDVLYNKLSSKSRNLIKEDYQLFLNSKKTTRDAMKFYKDINDYFVQDEKLQQLKDPIKNALLKTDPTFGKEFDLTNKVFQKYFKISKKMKPTMVSQFYEASLPYQVLGAVVTGNIPLLKGVALTAGTKKLASEMITNPRLQNLSSKFVSAINQGKYSAANKIKDQIAGEYNKFAPEVSSQLTQTDVEEFFESN